MRDNQGFSHIVKICGTFLDRTHHTKSTFQTKGFSKNQMKCNNRDLKCCFWMLNCFGKSSEVSVFW